LEIQLRTTKKGRSITIYLLKKIVDTLVVIGASISNDDHVETILDGLSDKYTILSPHFCLLLTLTLFMK